MEECFIECRGIYGISTLAGLMYAPTFFFVPLALALIEVILSLFLLAFASTRRIAQIMLVAAGITFLIGYSVCTVAPKIIHNGIMHHLPTGKSFLSNPFKVFS